MQSLPKISNIIKTFGTSMYPILLDGDVLYLKKVKFTKIKINDIITAKSKNYYFTHRVIYKNSKYLITKGDNNGVVDNKILPKDISGIVEKVKRDNQFLNPEDLYLFQSTLYFQEIIAIKRGLEKEKIDMVFLKGLPLHLYFEKTHPKRIYADCDILINLKDYEQAKSILKKFGYKKVQDNLSKKHKTLKNKESEISYIKLLNGFHVVFDIHFEIVFMMTQLGELNALYPQKLIDSLTEEFMHKKRLIKVENEKFPILSSDYLIIYLCLHLFHHNFKGTYRYDFIKNIIKKSNLSPKTTIKIIKKYRLDNFIYPCFLLLNKYYQTQIAKDILYSIKPDGNSLSVIKKDVLKVDIFEGEDRISGGVKRFKMIFFLSPEPFYKKILVFLNSEVIYSVLWVFYSKLDNKIKSLQLF